MPEKRGGERGVRQTIKLYQKASITPSEENTISMYLGYQLAASFQK